MDANSGNLDAVAKRYVLDEEQLENNNPAYKHGLISAQMPRRILMPAHLANNTFVLENAEPVDKIENYEKPETNFLTVENTGSNEVKNGETLSSIAKLYGLSLESLRKFNGLSHLAKLRAGQRLKLQR